MSVLTRAPQYLKKEIERLRSSTMFRNAGWMMFGQVTGFALQAVSFILLARLLSNVEYGVMMGAFAFCNLVGPYSALGTGVLFLRYVSVDRSRFAVYWGNILFSVTVMGMPLVLLLSFFGKHYLNQGSASVVMLWAVMGCICTPLIAECSRVFQTYEKMLFTAILNLSLNLMRAITVTVMLVAVHHATAWQWSMVSMVVSVITAIACVTAVIVSFGWPKISPRLFVKRFTEGFNLSFASSAASVYNDVDKTLLSHYNMNHANGVYSMAYRVVDIATMPIISIRDAAVPRLFQLGHESIRGTYELSVRLLKRALFVSLAAAAGMFLLAPLIPHLVGRGYTESVEALRWLCLLPLFRAFHQMIGAVMTTAGYQRYRTPAQFAVAIFNFGINLWLIPQFGWRGAAWSSLASDGGLAVLCYAVVLFLLSKEKAGLAKQAQVEN